MLSLIIDALHNIRVQHFYLFASFSNKILLFVQMF